MRYFYSILYLISSFSFLFQLEMGKLIDSDGDGYSDIIELEVGTNPNDKADRYYYGNWPYNPNKDKIQGAKIPISCPDNISCECKENIDCPNKNCQKAIRGSAMYCTPKPGDTFPRLIAVDQYGEFVDIYDFALQGKIIAIEFGAAWCSPCNDLSEWLSSGSEKIKSNRWWKDEYSIIKEKIDKGEIIFITILYQNEMREDMDYNGVESWHNKYPHSKIPVLADEYRDIHQWIKPTGYPCINLLNENMQFINFTSRGLSEAFDILSGLKPIPQLK